MVQATPFANALAEFSLNLYRQINTSKAGSNIFMSPLSISFALAMTYAGASGNTKKQMRSLLFGQWTEKQDEELHALYAEVMGLLNKSDAPYKLHLANRVYAHEPTLGELLTQFSNILKQKYSSELQPLDFGKGGGEEARGIINNWVGDKTNQKIKDLIPSGALSPLTRLVLVNAIYFKGDWKTKFSSEATRPMQFHAGPNKEVQVDMMSMNGKKFFYNETEGYQTLGMPYTGEQLFMFIMLPKEKHGLADMEKSLNGKNFLEAILNTNNEQKMEHVMVPKFKLEETVKLVEILKQLGATDMFDDEKADFSNINGKRDLAVSDVIHKAFIEVNEEGTEAAAATAVTMNIRCAMPQMNPSFIADHPFLFSIVDVRTNSILFLGRYFGSK